MHRPNLTPERFVREDWPEVFRLGLVLSVCLALPVNVATSLYVHMHTDNGHQNEHHDGREVHRHAEPNEAHHDGDLPDRPNQDHAPVDQATVGVASAAWRPALSPVSATIVSATDAPWLQLIDTARTLRAPGGSSAIVAMAPPGHPRPITVSTQALRGPPR